MHTFLRKFLQNIFIRELPTLRQVLNQYLKLPALNNDFKLVETNNMTQCGETMAERTGFFVKVDYPVSIQSLYAY